jgi:hypothetical protein
MENKLSGELETWGHRVGHSYERALGGILVVMKMFCIIASMLMTWIFNSSVRLSLGKMYRGYKVSTVSYNCMLNLQLSLNKKFN